MWDEVFQPQVRLAGERVVTARDECDALVGQGRLNADASGALTAAITARSETSSTPATADASDADDYNAELEEMMS